MIEIEDLFFIAIVFLVIMPFIKSLKNNLAFTSTNPSMPPFISQPVTKNSYSNYNPGLVQHTIFELMETMHIMNTSNAVDTIIGRYPILIHSITYLKSLQNNPRYRSDIQFAIDNYKKVYYDRIPYDFQLAVLINPFRFDISFFYCNCLLNGLRNFVNEQTVEINSSPNNDAKRRRINKIISVIQAVRKELLEKCNTIQNLSSLVEQLNNTEVGYRNLSV